MDQEDFKRKLTAILSADVEGYSRLMGEDEDSTVRTLTAYRKLMSSLIESFHGRVVDSPGDNLLAEFESVRDAVLCAVEIQEELETRNSNLPETRKMRFRIGINLGDVIKDGERIYGDGVNVAARVESLSKGGGISISGAVYDSIRDKLPMSYESMGEHVVKNIKRPVRVYKICLGSEVPGVIVEEKKNNKKSRQKIIPSIFILIIIGITAVWYLVFYMNKSGSDVKDGPVSIAVLPFLDISPENDQQYFVDGLSEEMLNTLAQIPGFNVTARTSSFSFRDSKKTIQEIAEILGVEYILEGSVRKVKNDLRITSQLIRSSDGFHLMSNNYDHPLENIFKIQEEIAIDVANKLKATLGIISFKNKGSTGNPAAYELYLIARGQLNNYQELSALKSIETALNRDPDFALAWALKANSHILIAGGGLSNNRIAEELDASLYSAQKAIKLEPELAEAHFALGSYYTSMENWIKAEQAYKTARELAPDSLSKNEFEPFFHYMCVGHFRKAKQVLEAQLQNDPLNMKRHLFYIRLLVGYEGNMLKAEKENELAKDLFRDRGDWPGDAVIARLRLSRGEKVDRNAIPKDVLTYYDLIGIDFDSSEKSLAAIHRLYDRLGSRLPADTLGNIAVGAAYFNDHEFAMDLIEKSGVYRVNNIMLMWLPVMQGVRQLPGFKEFVREIGLVDFWKQYGWPDLCHEVSDDDFVCK